MTIAVEVLSKLERRITITVAFQPLETEIEERLNLLSREAEFEGYRLGKAPMYLVNQRYGDKLRVEIYSGSVEKSFGKAVEEKKYALLDFLKLSTYLLPMVIQAFNIQRHLKFSLRSS